MKLYIETEFVAAEIIQQCNASELIDIMESIIVALYEYGFDDIKEHIDGFVDSLGEAN